MKLKKYKIDRKVDRKMCIELRPHNQITYDKIQEMWKESNKVASVQPTGTGKSFLILKCAESFGEELKVVVTPNNPIINQLIEHADGNVANIKYITYISLANMTDDELKSIETNFIALDEFHHCGAKVWGDGVKRLIETHPNAKILGTSATSIRYLDGNRDMADELFDGHLACNMTLSQAIIKEILQMPKYVSALYTFDTEADRMIERVNKSKNSDKEKLDIIKDIKKLKRKLDKSNGIPTILAKYITKANGKYIIFCENTRHLHEMKEVVIGWFKKYFNTNKILNYINAYDIYSDLPNWEEQLEAFENDNTQNAIKLIFSINKLNEGLHIKTLDGVILLRPTTSPTTYYQQIGRVIDVGREDQTLILDFVNNFDSIKKNSLKNELEVAARDYCGNNGISGDSEEDFVNKFRIYDETYDVVSLFSIIENRLYDNWDLNILAADQFIKREGHSNIPRNYIEAVNEIDVNLGNFRQGLMFNNYIITEERIHQLNQIGFNIKKFRNDFNFWVELTEKIKCVTGNANVSKIYEYNGYKIGAWQNTIRQCYKNGKLTKEEISRLNSIGFIYDTIEYKWNIGYDELVEYYNKYGNTDVPYSYKINGINLGHWTSRQRVAFKKNKLSNDKINKLKQIDFNFSIGHIDRGTKQVVCLDTIVIFHSLVRAGLWCGLKNASAIVNNIANRTSSAGVHPETGEPLHWMYLDEYLKLHPEEVENLKEAI